PCPPGAIPVPVNQCQTPSTGSCQTCCKSIASGVLAMVPCGQPCPNGYVPTPQGDCQGSFANQQCCKSVSLGSPRTTIVPLGQPCPDGFTPAPMSTCQGALPGGNINNIPQTFNFQDSCTIGWNNTTSGNTTNVIANFKGIHVGGDSNPWTSSFTCLNCDSTLTPPLIENPPLPAVQCCLIPGGGFFYVPGGTPCPAGTMAGNPPQGCFIQAGATCCF